MNKNIYSTLVPSDWYNQYKKADTLTRKSIQMKVFKLVRLSNKFPYNDYKLSLDIQKLRVLSSLDISKLYRNTEILVNTIGKSLCQDFYPNIWDITRNYKGVRLASAYESFFIDKDLKEAIKENLSLDDDISGLRNRLVSHTSNFRPSVAKVVYDMYLPKGGRVLDYSSGYGGRILGAHASDNCDVYIGVEPNTQTYSNGNKFINFLNDLNLRFRKAYLYNIGSEDFTINAYPRYTQYFDIALSSPAYSNSEIYSNEITQSYIKFKDYPSWVKGYLRPTIHNSVNMLKETGIFAINFYEDTEEYNKSTNIKNIVRFICNEKDFKLINVDYILPDKPENENKESIWYFKREGIL